MPGGGWGASTGTTGSSGGGLGSALGAIGGFLGGPAGGILGSVVGGLFGKSGQSSANRANLRIARENRAWQERMSNTAYQRAALDLEKAGLNRILALGNSASTPAGNVATMQNENAAGVEAASAVNSMRLMAAQRKQAQEMVKNIGMDTSLKKAQANYVQSQDAETQQRTYNLNLQAMGIPSANKILAAEAELKKLGIAGMKSEEDMWKKLQEWDLDELTKVAPTIGPILANFMRLFMLGQRTKSNRGN